MSIDWKQGDIATGSIDTYTGRFINRGDYSGWDELDGNDGGWDADYILNLRPLVVIDPEDRTQVGLLADALTVARSDGEFNTASSQNVDTMQAALREFANPTPPKPAEPQGLGAVVTDVSGTTYVRSWPASDDLMTHPWRALDRFGSLPRLTWKWSEIEAMTVLSEGVTL